MMKTKANNTMNYSIWQIIEEVLKEMRKIKDLESK